MDSNKYLGEAGAQQFGADMMKNAMGMFQMRNQWTSKMLGVNPDQNQTQNQNADLTDQEAMNELKKISKKIDQLSDDVESGNEDYSKLEDLVDTLSLELSDKKLLKTDIHVRKQKKLCSELEELREQVEEIRKEAKKNRKKNAKTAIVGKSDTSDLQLLELTVNKFDVECSQFKDYETDESYTELQNKLQQISATLRQMGNDEKATELAKAVRKSIAKLTAKAIENEELGTKQSNKVQQYQLPVVPMNLPAMGGSMSSMMANMNIGELAQQSLSAGLMQNSMSTMQGPLMPMHLQQQGQLPQSPVLGGQEFAARAMAGIENLPENNNTVSVKVKQEIRGPMGYKKTENKFNL